MKNNKILFRIIATLMSLALALGVIVALGTLSVGATDEAVDTAQTEQIGETEEQERETIPVPEVPAIDRPYKTIEELGIDYEKIDAYFPQNIEIRYEGGKVYVEDFGASSLEIYDSAISDYVSLELIDGYWTAELSAAPTIVYVYCSETSIDDRLLTVAYYGDGHRDQYIRLYDSVISVDVSFAIKYGNVAVLYQSGNYYYEDRYEDGVLDTHGVSNLEDEENTNQVLYGIDGKIRYCTLYTDGYYHYFPEQGWSSNWEKFVACDAPTGYETVDETYFTANKPSLICAEAKGDDIVHDMSKAYCTTPSTCKNGCGYTIGEIDYHDWQLVDGKKECSICDAVFFPDFEFIDRTYNNLEESDFPYDEIKAVFPKVLTVKYEDGKYMVKDVGADKAKAYNDVDYENIKLSLVDGWWICELDEEIYNDESIKLFVYFEGEIDGIYWNITYTNGTVNSDLYLMSMSDDLGVLVYYDDYDQVVSMYYVGDRLYNDEYKNGALDSQEGSIFVGEDHVYIEYLADGSLERVRIYIGEDWYYYYPDGVWEKGVEVLLAPPAGYENADVAYFESIIPTTINCAHENFSEADCENPERCLICGIVKEGSEALGHDIMIDEAVEPTCTETGLTEGYHCTRCDEMTVAQEEIPTSDHEYHARWIDPTCTEPGGIEDFCLNCSWKMRDPAEQVPALGHDYVDGICSRCNETEVETDTEDGGSQGGNDRPQGGTNKPQGGTNKPQGGNQDNYESESEKTPVETESETEKNVHESETEKKGAQTTEKGDGSENKENNSGCKSSVGIGIVAIVTILGAAIVFKKKEQ